ncbi:Ni,Fe-hydrogenase I large subunit [Dehalogenimonas alkenigignens]|uniref:Ni,Fe-hydrogenase I large subunit n=1 Tax=Dehalogenimonas alkenigignens TaxID=1217799 RepID=A0A0W0GK89_9CHLR|nr:nickel-dependent hydrogenase large subunit [Dehalogenimonas alkenigignens]KTB48961.1 Ni,Fe-hydrogenase I large subunit [Dehalogenimonas alkenigignens]
MTRVVVDPLTRIEGHLRIEVEVNNGVITDAWSAGTMARGIEILLKNRDPWDAPYVTSRLCGVCEGVHAIASAQALEDAFDIELTEAGRLMRNVFCAGYYVHDHYVHFYVLSALDYLDIMAIANYKGSDPGLLGIKDKIVGLVVKGDTSPFTPRYEPDAFTVNDPETVTTLVSHYIKAIEMKAKSQKMLNFITGIQPHPNTVMVGGCVATPSREQLLALRDLWLEQKEFVDNVYLPDVLAVGTGPLFPLAKLAIGATDGNYLAYPMLPQDGAAKTEDISFGGSNHLFKGGVVNASGARGTLSDIAGINVAPVDYSKITESVTSSWYNYPQGSTALHPSVGVTEFNLNKTGAYSYFKSPRYSSKPMEVGPLARGLVNKFPALVDFFKAGGREGVVARHLCRALITKSIVDQGIAWIDRLIELRTAGPLVGMNEKAVPRNAKGFGVWDAPRGALGHWVEIENHRIKNYQMVVPSTWNAGPRDENGVKGPYEQSLIGAPVPDTENPINVVRIIRSFDPCIACGVHVIDGRTGKVKVINLQ